MRGQRSGHVCMHTCLSPCRQVVLLGLEPLIQPEYSSERFKPLSRPCGPIPRQDDLLGMCFTWRRGLGPPTSNGHGVTTAVRIPLSLSGSRFVPLLSLRTE